MKMYGYLKMPTKFVKVVWPAWEDRILAPGWPDRPVAIANQSQEGYASGA